MLYLILTQRRLLAGYNRGGKLEWLNPNGTFSMVPQGKSPVQVLGASLGQIESLYRRNAGTEAYSAGLPIPLAIAYSVNNPQNNGRLNEDREIREVMAKAKDNKFELLILEPLPIAYLRGEGKDKEPQEQPSLVFEALENHLNVCFCHFKGNKIHEKVRGNGAFQYIPYEKIGPEAGLQQAMDDIGGQLTKAGLKLDTRDKIELRKQLEGGSPGASGKKITLLRQKGTVKIKAEINFTHRRYEELAAAHLGEIAGSINRDKIEQLGIKQVALLGDFLDNSVIKGYLTKDLRLASVISPSVAEKMAYQTVLSGLDCEAVIILKAREDEVRLRQEEEARLKALETARQLNIEKESLMGEILTTCVDPDKQAEYEQTFVPKAGALGIPAEVVTWNIAEALRSVALQLPVMNTSSVSLARQTHAGIPAEQALPSIHDEFKIGGVLIDSEFATKKVSIRGESGQKVMRILDAAKVNDPQQLSSFKHLYGKELAYYQELSEIKEAREGMYYTRDFIPRDTLKEYFKKTGLDKKASFDKLSSKDIKFVLEVFDEVKNLPGPHAHLNEYNILVIQEGLFKRNLSIKFVGFTSRDCSVSEMEETLHALFSNLFGPKTYAEFRNKVNP